MPSGTFMIHWDIGRRRKSSKDISDAEERLLEAICPPKGTPFARLWWRRPNSEAQYKVLGVDFGRWYGRLRLGHWDEGQCHLYGKCYLTESVDSELVKEMCSRLTGFPPTTMTGWMH